MCYLVTWQEGRIGNGRSDKHAIWDTEEQARSKAETLLKAGADSVSVWKQIATPTLEQVVQWKENCDG